MATRGPKTPEGKAKVGANAVKYGLFSHAPVIREVESLDEWNRHVESVVASLEPEGYLESEMALRIAELAWRMRRVSHYEAEAINLALDQMPDMMVSAARYAEKVTGEPLAESITPEKVDMQVGIRMLPDGPTLDKIMRYEAHLHRLSLQTLHELEAMQGRRRGERSPLARIDYSGGGLS